MRSSRIVCLLFLAFQAFPLSALAQDDAIVKQPVLPARLPELNDLIEGKIDEKDGEQQLVVLADAYRTEKRAGKVTKFRQEQRKRSVVGRDGKAVEQTYTVNVPFSEDGEVVVKIPAGRKPIAVPIEHCKFYSIQGERIDANKAALQLKEMQPIFLIDVCHGELREFPRLFTQVLKEDCLIVTTSNVVREDPTSRNAFGVPLP
jgi:hypothetical protein